MRLRNYLLSSAVFVSCLVYIGIFASIFGLIFFEAGSSLNWDFLSEVSKDSGRAGGIIEVLVSSALILIIALALALPLSIASALFVVGFVDKERIGARQVRISLDTLAATPSIVFGLFGYSFFVIFLDFGFSILAGGLTLACMILPFLIRIYEHGISAAFQEQELSSASLGISKTTTFFSIVLPLSASAISAGLVLAVGRAMSETAALLFTSGYVLRMPDTLLDSGRTMSVHIYDLSMNVPGGNENAYKTAVVLVFFTGFVNLLACFLAKRLSGGTASSERGMVNLSRNWY